MEALHTLIENQYHTPGLYEEILKRLEEQEVDLEEVSRGDIAGVDEFHVRGADDASKSFLETTSHMDDILERLCLKRLITSDQTYEGILFLQELFEKLKTHGPPKIGLNVLMGSATKEKLENILKGLEEKQIVLQSGIYKKRAIN